ncbi:glycosyl hydrolase [Echinicola strongylocentroti]|uniref:Glycosyl hydrolase n=1 Tax=Echinicola strongylocentroti TaxID=1795355 RepID=A0A2Z4ILD4_9BACT|nr:glycosyl hydrolase 115 family protein [Echinicola strongylocentroti]AWW31376.1 glycosyl hydrolase [Echinicola strongylocentroti]
MNLVIRLFFFLILPQFALGQINLDYENNLNENVFEVVNGNKISTIYYDRTDAKLVERTASLFAEDVERITDIKPNVTDSLNNLKGNVVIIGTIGQSEMIDSLAKKHAEFSVIKGDWERFVIKTISQPFDGVDEALVIAGSDKRGTAFGVFTLSEQIGVSPWYWWADVPPKKSDALNIENLSFVSDSPSVKYRGIFLNDESPALRYWATEKFGGLNHRFYEKVYELLLRNKANYLWPAMWLPTAFSDDDPLNPQLADEYGIVISTSHHEPMMRAHDEWRRYKGGAWNYETNKEQLQAFWKGGIERMGDYESVVTVGMRGDGDEAMSEDAAVDLMQTIIADQRKIISEVTKRPAEEVPQVWAIYKEVQEYYDKGMRVDDDIMILLCDDNWGNVRMLPKKEDADYKGGFGMYYHFDYVGAPVSYRWQNVTQIERTWEQMKLSYDWGVEDLWLVNVGDIKPMEFPISFFLDMAWDVEAFSPNSLPEYYVNWARQQFGNQDAEEIANIIALYTKYNARRVPEMLTPETYSLKNYREADRVLSEFKHLLQLSDRIYNNLSENYKSAYYQLVHSPLAMCSNLNEMYITAAKNKLYAEQGRASANVYADKVKKLFYRDKELTRQYHEDLENGKWNHMMSQTHIGYTSWNHPPANKMPPVSYVQTHKSGTLGYMLENGSEPDWGGFSVEGDGLYSESFSQFDPINDQHYYIDVFNRGDAILDFTITAKNDWIILSSKGGSVQYDQRIDVSIDWDKAPKENSIGEIEISGAGHNYLIEVPIRNISPKVAGFIENNGVVSIEAANYTKKQDAKDAHWEVIPNLGRTHSSIVGLPMNHESQELDENTSYVEYEFTLLGDKDLKIETYLSPTQDFLKNGGLKFAVAVDNEKPTIININKDEVKPDWEYAEWWTKSVGNHIKKRVSTHENIKAGIHTLKVWLIDPGVVIQKFVIDAGGLKPSYLGPPESLNKEI